MVIAVFAGIFAGVLSALPLYLGLRGTKRMDATSAAAGYMTPMLLAVGGSFVVLFLATVVCVLVAKDVLLPFAFGEAGTLIVAALGYGIATAVRK